MKINAVIFYIGISIFTANALSVDIPSNIFLLSENQTMKTIRVNNPTQRVMAIQVSLLPKNKPSHLSIDQSQLPQFFWIHPSQFILTPNEEQVVQLKWVKAKKEFEKMAFILTVEQLNLSFEKNNKSEGVMMVRLADLKKIQSIITVNP